MKALKKIDKSRLIAIRNDEILVLKKVGEKKKYSLAGGVKKKKECDTQSLIRETFEEIGVQLKKKNLKYFISRKTVTKYNQEVYRHYFITTKEIRDKIIVQETNKFESALWVPWFKALEYLDKEDKKAVTLYFEQL